MKKECQCQVCINACWDNPGWFGSIGEVKGAAGIMGLGIVDFCAEYLIQEWHSWKDHNDILVPAPRRDFNRMTEEQRKYLELFPESIRFREEEGIRNGRGFVVASWGHNLFSGYACIFLTEDNKCRIHESKPTECRKTLQCENILIGRKGLLPYWKRRQRWFSRISEKIEKGDDQ